MTLPVANGGASLPAKTNPPKPVDSLRELLLRSKDQIALALPKHLTPERMIRMATTAFLRNPGLQECSPLSIVGCVIEAAQLGLELTGPLGQAYMVPFKNKHTGKREAQFQVGYRGLLKLAFNSRQVSYFNAHEVRENDLFAYEYGTNQKLVHKPALKDRGEITAFYASIRLKDGSSDFEVMSKEEIDAHAKQYSASYNGASSPWKTAYAEMGKKTVIRRLAKRCPVSSELMAAATLDEYAEAGVPQGLALALPEGNGVPVPPSSGREKLDAPPEQEAEPEPEEPFPETDF